MAEATFDPNGPYDDAAFVKDPIGSFDDAVTYLEPLPSSGSGPDGLSAAPSNDNCSSATVIPGNIVTYNPSVYSTATATSESCEGSETCGGLGTSHSVWYSYTPDQDGVMAIDTFGSSYDTVLSVFDRCGAQVGIFCVLPNQLACNNNFGFGTQSQIYMNVSAGQNYRIKVAAAFGVSGGSLNFNLRYIAPNDSCVDATEILGTAYAPPLLSTHNAQTDVCEPNESCEFNGIGVSNSVWYSYTPPCDGLMSVNTNGSTYDTVLSIWDGCSVLTGGTNCNYPTELACDDDAGSGTASQILDFAVVAGTTYLIKVADYNTTQGGGYLDFHLVFDGANQPVADLLVPSNFASVCGTASIQGTADVGGGYVGWELDVAPTATGAWTSLASGTNEVQSSVLANWNTTSLAEGYYLLRLVVSNACGVTEADTAVVYVDQSFSGLALRAPGSGAILGGRVNVDGTAWDRDFRHYTLDYRSLSSSLYFPLDPSMSLFTTPITNDPLLSGGWDTLAAGISDGDYDVRLVGIDNCGNTAQDNTTVTIDNTPPIAVITEPAPRSRHKGAVAVRGTANDLHLASWTLEVTGGTSDEWTLLAQGTSPVVDSVFANWNTGGLAPGPYTLRLIVEDASILSCGERNRTESLVSVHVGKTTPVLK